MTTPLSLLKDPTLLKTNALINGQGVAGTSRFAVTDPATGLARALGRARFVPSQA